MRLFIALSSFRPDGEFFFNSDNKYIGNGPGSHTSPPQVIGQSQAHTGEVVFQRSDLHPQVPVNHFYPQPEKNKGLPGLIPAAPLIMQITARSLLFSAPDHTSDPADVTCDLTVTPYHHLDTRLTAHTHSSCEALGAGCGNANATWKLLFCSLSLSVVKERSS